MMQAFSRPYPSRSGLPVLEHYDPRIFTFRYFGRCMECNFCHDSCCQFGADIEVTTMQAILNHADALEPYLGREREEWFRLDPADIGLVDDPLYLPGGQYTRTAVVDLPSNRSPHNREACVFLDPAGRGCKLHRFGLEQGIDVYAIKPMVCLLFPLAITNTELIPSLEFDDNDLVCIGPGPTLFQSAKPDLRYYFGDEMVAELEAVEPFHAEPVRGRVGVALL